MFEHNIEIKSINDIYEIENSPNSSFLVDRENIMNSLTRDFSFAVWQPEDFEKSFVNFKDHSLKVEVSYNTDGGESSGELLSLKFFPKMELINRYRENLIYFKTEHIAEHHSNKVIRKILYDLETPITFKIEYVFEPRTKNSSIKVFSNYGTYTEIVDFVRVFNSLFVEEGKYIEGEYDRYVSLSDDNKIKTFYGNSSKVHLSRNNNSTCKDIPDFLILKSI